MDIKFSDYPFSVTLIFYVIGSNAKVHFDCSEIVDFRIVKEWNDEPMYVALEAYVKPPKLTRESTMSDDEFFHIDHTDYLWEVRVDPEANLNIICLSFNWCIQKITNEELSWFNT
jgi:hypothetical protein